MPYTVSLDFKAGVDRRRPQSAGPAGSLYEAINCHITRGGDIEKRKAFVAKYALPAAQTFGLARASGLLYTFGSAASPSVPAGIAYQRLQHPDSVAMSALLDWDTFSGKIYAAARYTDGSIHHFYDGSRVTDWDNGVVRAAFANNSGTAAHLEDLIDDVGAVTSSVLANVITLTAPVAGTAFTLTAETENVTGGTSNQTAAVATTTPNAAEIVVPSVTEVLAQMQITVNGGTASAGVNLISSLRVNGVEILGASVDHTGNNTSTAAAIAAQCVTFASTPEYTVTNEGAVITIKALAGTGAGSNGFAVAYTVAGDMTMTPASGVGALAGGVTAVSGSTTPAVAQVSTVTIGGTFEVGDKFTVLINGVKYGNKFMPSVKGDVCFTHKSKVYACCGSLLEFSGVNTAIGWNSEDDTGASFINMANQDGGSQTLTGLGAFQKNLAVFADDVVQVWNTAADPASNSQLQVLKNTGTDAKDSVVPFGYEDLAYLDQTGIRSLRARTGVTDVASVDDVGTPIDTYVQEYLDTVSTTTRRAACAITDPRDGRLWMAVGQRIFVYSSFPRAKINAWTTYEPGFTVDAMVTVNRRIYVRSGDTVYLYGGDDNATYDESQVTVTLPFFHDNKPATCRDLRGFDADLSNLWAVTILVNPDDLTQYVDIGNIEGLTYIQGNNQGGNIKMPVRTTHAAPKFVNTRTGYARISNFAVHFERGGVEMG